MESEEKKKAYNEYVERITPNNSLTKDMWNAFWIGGLICVMGQIWLELFMYFGMDKEDSASYTTLILILESAILTGLNVYPKIAKKGGAGCLVPITGFANGTGMLNIIKVYFLMRQKRPSLTIDKLVIWRLIHKNL